MKGDEFFRQFANKRPFSKLHPNIAAFFKDYLSNEKFLRFNDQFVLNTHFPPYPSAAFNNLIENLNYIGQASDRRLHSVTLAVTNKCNYRCWHCYNAGRSQNEISLPVLQKVAKRIQDLGAVMVTLSGGEPLLRDDLEEIAKAFDERTCLNINTTGDGLTLERAVALHKSGIFAMGISLDSTDEKEHDRMRGRKGAFKTALNALEFAGKSGLYPYVISVATHDFLQPGHFWRFIRFAADAGAREVHLIEPCATGNLAGKTEVLLRKDDRQLILDYQKEAAERDNLPILSSFTYLESPHAFGCGAGLTHLYIDGSGEVSPCNLVPISFGNIQNELLDQILDKMGKYFSKPRSSCVGRTLSKHIPHDHLPTAPDVTAEICEKYLPKEHSIPRFFQIVSETKRVGNEELRDAYDKVGEFYDEFWVTEAGKPVVDLIRSISIKESGLIIEAGCGTGFATRLLADKYKMGKVLAVDLSSGMIEQAKKRLGLKENVRFIQGDALEILNKQRPFDLIFSSWVMGYIPLKPFFEASYNALSNSGKLAFVVHKEDSPYVPLQIFSGLVAEDPSVLQKHVAFDFPVDISHVRSLIESAGLKVGHIWDGKIVFSYDTPEQVLEHLLKSGAGTAFYDAIDPVKRSSLEQNFLRILAERTQSRKYEVVHDYISCIAVK